MNAFGLNNEFEFKCELAERPLNIAPVLVFIQFEGSFAFFLQDSQDSANIICIVFAFFLLLVDEVPMGIEPESEEFQLNAFLGLEGVGQRYFDVEL